MKSRTERRKGFDDKTRTALLEDDMDTMESTFNQLKESQRRILTALWSLMSALLVGIVLLALNLALGTIPAPG